MVVTTKTSQEKFQWLIDGNDPFLVEKFRDFLARNHQVSLLKETYSGLLPEIKNINTPSFWNNVFENKNKEIKSHIEQDKIENVLKFLRNEKGNLLDIGFGQGILEEQIVRRKMSLKLYGIDISDYAVKTTRKKVKGKFIKSSATNIPFNDNFFHIVVALELMEHIPPKYTLAVLSEIYRVLKNGGKVILSIPLNEGLEDMVRHGRNPIGHLRVYSPELIKAELKLVGLNAEKEILFYAFKNFYLVKKLLQMTIFKSRWNPNNVILIAQKHHK